MAWNVGIPRLTIGALALLVTGCSTLAHAGQRIAQPGDAQVEGADLASVAAVEGRPRPNVIVVMADDIDSHAFAHLPVIRRQVMHEGLTYENAFSGTPLSAAARATLLTGQRTRDHRNWTTYGSSGGGGGGFTERGGFEHTLATMVPSEYFTGFFGKVMPGYGTHGSTPVTPPGWDRWFGMLGGGYRGTLAWQNGRRVRIDDWFIDAIEHRVTRSIIEEPDPLFMIVAPFNVHDEVQVEPRYEHAFQNVRYPRSAAFSPSAEDMRLKPPWVRQMSDGIDLDEVDRMFRTRLRAALPVDALVRSIIDTLEATGRLENTYLIVTSDNGFRHDEFGIGFGKNDPYDPSQRIPLAIRGPGVARDAVHTGLVSFVDLPATLLALTGARIPPDFDGVSLVPSFDATTPVRPVHLIEGMRGDDDNVVTFAQRARAIRYRGFRTLTEKYIETRGRDGLLHYELYDLVADPAEVHNLYPVASDSRRLALARRLDSLMASAA